MTDHDLLVDGETRRRPSAEDRRASSRSRSGMLVPVLPVGPADGLGEQAKVRDVSSFGIGLLMSHRVEYGHQLIIDLDSATGGMVHRVLGRVVHVTAQLGGDWLIGCALVGEMDEDGLKVFEAGRVRPANADCRAWVRFPCNIETVCRTVETVPGEQMPGRVVNVSAGGVGLLLPCQFETRTLLSLNLPGPRGQQPQRVLIRAVQARPHTQGNWYLGCEFVDRLEDEEIAVLIRDQG
jgi:hypothetical protein